MSHLIYHNFIYQIESITPTSNIVRKGFHFNNDPERLSANQSSGMVRSFEVHWLGSDEDDEVTDITERIADHKFTVTIAYPVDYKLKDLYSMILQDRSDITKRLRDSTYRVGYSATNPTTDIGLWARIRESDSIDKSDDNVWYLKMEFTCKIIESEI